MSDDLAGLARDLFAADRRVRADVKPVMARAAVQTKARMRAEASGHRHAPTLAASISYDPVDGGMGFECGPVAGSAGSLAFYYFGNSKVNASIPDPVIILNDEAEKARGWLAAAVSSAVLR